MGEKLELLDLTERMERLEETVGKIDTFCKRLFASLDGETKKKMFVGVKDVDPWDDDPYQ